MTCASGFGRGGCAMARLFLTIVLALGMTVSWAGAEAEKTQAAAGSPPVVTLGTLSTGACKEVQRYAESVVGIGVIRSAVEVQRGCNTVSRSSPCIRKWLSTPLFLISYFTVFDLTSLVCSITVIDQ